MVKKDLILLDFESFKFSEKSKKFDLLFLDYLIKHYNVEFFAYSLKVLAKGAELLEKLYPKKEFDGYLLDTLVHGKLKSLKKEHRVIMITEKLIELPESTRKQSVLVLKHDDLFKDFIKDLKEHYIKTRKPLKHIIEKKEIFKRFSEHFKLK